MDVNNLSCLNDLNHPGLPELKTTREQEHLYDCFETFDIYVNGTRIHVRGDKKALSGEFTGMCPVILKFEGGGFVRVLEKRLFKCT